MSAGNGGKNNITLITEIDEGLGRRDFREVKLNMSLQKLENVKKK
jgi:hypothetical protein